MDTKEIIKAKTIEHYTHHFGLEDLGELGHGDKTMIDWGIELIQDFISDGNKDGTSVNSLHKHVVNNCGCYRREDLNPELLKTIDDIEDKLRR